jgi:TRAP-type uncharacterized transport system fused permease subunit
MALALPWIFLFVEGPGLPGKRHAASAGSAPAACIWIAWNHSAGDQYGFLEGDGQTGIAVVLLAGGAGGGARAIGWPLPTVALLALAYGLFGQYIPANSAIPARRSQVSSAR